MNTATRSAAFVSLLLLLPAPIGAQSAHDILAAQLGLQPPSGGAVEIRVWVESNARVDQMYRVIKLDSAVSVERFAFAEVVHPPNGFLTAKEAERETKTNRHLLQKERCAAKLVETPDYMACRVALDQAGPWSVLFDDLLPDQLRTLAPQPRPGCESLVVLDGETVTIDVFESAGRHTVAYSNPDVCCPTVGCAIADRALSLVRKNIR